MTDAPVPAAVREDDRWELVEETEEDLGKTGPVRVTARRTLYGDRRLRERVREATGVDRQWRSLFASTLVTAPPLSRGITDLVVRTVAAPVAGSRFAADLRDRGFEGVGSVETSRPTVGDGTRARATRFSARIPVEGADPVDAEALLAVWGRDDHMLAAGGTYPVGRLRTAAGEAPFDPPAEYRRDLLELIRTVG
ncbi:hypothetical protein BRD00_14675 [Halobacteriales archaeon QS_8_69_26]|nr:MAG: hypothetical protein BRD00_14675 [Halobacteriales archaeon QS_8_69_26]